MTRAAQGGVAGLPLWVTNGSPVWASKCLLSGVKRTSNSDGGTSESSQQQTLETCPDDGQQAYSSPARLSWSVKRSSCFWSLYGCDSANAAKLKSGWFLSTFRAALRASSP